METSLFSQLSTLAASLALLFGLLLLWRHNLGSYIDAFRGQSLVISALFVVVGIFSADPELYVVAAVFVALKVFFIPRTLRKMQIRFAVEREREPYLNVPASLILAGLLVVLAYGLMHPLAVVSTLPTRGGLPLALGLVFVGLLVILTRKKAFTQVIGFLILENGITLLALLGTYGIPLIVELGVFLDALMGFLVMQIVIYQLHGTFESIDVDQLNQLKH
jgi:hydrogenase-4 component E